MILKFPNIMRKRKDKDADISASPLSLAFVKWKVDYGFAIHGNYTFYLPLEEVQRRWDKAHESERGFKALIDAAAKLIKNHSTWIHIIEAQIERLEKQRDMDLLCCPIPDQIGMDDLEDDLKKARALLADAMASGMGAADLS